MTFGVTSIDRQTLLNNTVGLAKAAKVFNVPVILTTVETESYSGNMWPQFTEFFPVRKPIERSSMNSWEDEKFVAEVERIGRKKLVIAALWTEGCLAFPAIQAMVAGVRGVRRRGRERRDERGGPPLRHAAGAGFGLRHREAGAGARAGRVRVCRSGLERGDAGGGKGDLGEASRPTSPLEGEVAG